MDAPIVEPVMIMYPCPECGSIIPDKLKVCWSCGAVLDHRLLELTKEAE